MSSRGWIGVDLDGTLAQYDGWRGIRHIGEPVEHMVKRVQLWLRDGQDVRVFTARICKEQDGMSVEEIRSMIEGWCEAHVGVALPVTNVKDFEMVELWDDRCVQVIPNMGSRADAL